MAKFMLDGQEYCGGGSQIVELTQVEYDALPDTKKTDNILYAITDCDELSAENMSCKDASGNLSNVQTELDKLNNETVQLNVNLTPTDSVSSIREYLRYSIIGNLCIVDIGGISISSYGKGQVVTNELPIPRTRGMCILSVDTGGVIDGTLQEAHTVCYTSIGSSSLCVHVSTSTVNQYLYGQMMYFI